MEEENMKDEEVSEEEFVEAEEEAEKEFEEASEVPKKEEQKVDSFNREMHKAVCSECGKECEVPFQPTEGRPVYCRDCYRKHAPRRRF